MTQEMMGWQWHQLDHMQIICSLLQTGNHASTLPLSFHRPDALPDVQLTASKHQSIKSKSHTLQQNNKWSLLHSSRQRVLIVYNGPPFSIIIAPLRGGNCTRSNTWFLHNNFSGPGSAVGPLCVRVCPDNNFSMR